MTRKSDPIIVVGGGLGGLAAALALARHGYGVRVIEQAPEFGAIGYGIQLGPNVFPMFALLGVSDAVLRECSSPPAVLMRDAFTGEESARIATGARFRDRFGHPYIIIHRIDLHRVLLDACARTPGIELLPNTSAAGYELAGERVLLRTGTGGTITGAALIGADGLRSTIRAQLVREGEPRMIGYVAHRTIVPMSTVTADVHREEVVLWAGPGFHIVHYPLRHGTLFNIVAVFRTSTYSERGEVAAYRAELQKTYRDAHPSMQALLAMMDLERRWAISDRDPIRNWSDGRVTLLGDAAHPTLQSLAQGACMAIEDALCLANLVALRDGDFAAAFRDYQAARLVRTARVQLESRYLWDHVYHVDGIERDVVQQTFAGRSQEDMYQCLAWLYEGFALPTGAGAGQSRQAPGSARP